MALDFGILQPVNIGGQIMAGQQEAQRNQLARQQLIAGQQQMQTAAMQQEKAGMELSAFQRRQDALAQFVKDAKDNGKNGTLEDNLNSYYNFAVNSGDPQHIEHAMSLRQAAQDRSMFENYVKGQNPAPSAAPPAAAMPSIMRQSAPTNALGSGTYGMDTGAPALEAPVAAPVATPAAPVSNQLAPAPAADVNQLAAGPAQIAKLKREINELSLLKDPRAAKPLAAKEAELKILQTPHVVPGVGLANAAGDVFVEAKATPTNLARMQAEMDALPIGDPRRAQYASAIQKETQNAPTQLAQLIKERDALPPNDPNRKLYDTVINKTQTEINIQKAHLKLAQDRFNQEFSMGKLSPETIDMMANKYLIDGSLPAIGAGKKGAEAKAQILDRALQISTGNGANPAQTAANVVQGKQDVAGQTAAIKDFSSGLSARRVTANNTALNHLETMDKLAGDLANADTRIVNAAGNAFARATGSAAPTNFDAAKQLVAAEVVKAVTQNGGGVTERKEAADNIKSANSPEQLRGVIQTYRELLGGQLTSLAQQYETGTGRKDFEKKLSPATRGLLKQSTPAAAPAPAGTVDTTNKWLK